LGRGVKLSGTRRRLNFGFSLVELVVSLAIVLILTAIALPSLTRSYRTYQLNDAATRLAAMLKYTRFEAIRRNKPISCQIQQISGNWTVWADTIGNSTVDPSEQQLLLIGTAVLLPSAGLPAPNAIVTGVGGGSLTTYSGANNSVTFDARGAVSPVPNTTYVLYIGSSTNPEFGYRAVVLLPSGVTQIWTAPSGGPWARVG
jgi:prepilin-type N-terminal cleavage/methylation domain-containing protein